MSFGVDASEIEATHPLLAGGHPLKGVEIVELRGGLFHVAEGSKQPGVEPARGGARVDQGHDELALEIALGLPALPPVEFPFQEYVQRPLVAVVTRQVDLGL